jgi:hypothetical protein
MALSFQNLITPVGTPTSNPAGSPASTGSDNSGLSFASMITPVSQPDQTTQPQPTGNNPSGLPATGVVPDIVKGIGQDYANAIPNFLKAAGSGQSSNPVAAVGEGALAATASGISTIFSPITQTISKLSDALSNNPTIQKMVSGNNGFDKLLDAVGTAHNAINDWSTKNPELSSNLNNALTVGTAALGGEAEPAVNEGLASAGTKIGEGINAGSEAIVKPVVDSITGGASKLSDSLQQASLKLTPTQISNLGSKLTDVKNYLSDNKITGNPETRLEKIDTKYNEAEDNMQNFLTNDAKDSVIDKPTLLQNLDNIKNDYKFDRDSKAIGNQIDEAKQTIQDNFPDKIPAADLNVFKRSTYAGAYNKAGSKVLDSVEHDIGDTTYKAIQDSVAGKTINGKSMADFNKEYGTIIQARKILKAAVGRPQIGLVGNIVSRLVGGTIGGAVGLGPIGETAGLLGGKAVAEVVAGTAVKSKLASMLK